MTALFQARLQLDERLTPAELAGFETVFSELLDAAATAHLRDGGGDWLIEALFTDPPAEDAVASLLAPVFADCGLAPVPVAITPLAQRDWLAENRAAFPPRRIGRFWIYGSHVETPPPPTSWPLLVEAAQAFGSGRALSRPRPRIADPHPISSARQRSRLSRRRIASAARRQPSVVGLSLIHI